MKEELGKVAAFLQIFLPQLAALGPALQLIPMARAAFQKVGGTDADFDKILADNQIDIDRLGDPDSFRQREPKGGGGPVDQFPYGEELTTRPDESRLVSGDKIFQFRTESRFIVIGNIGRDPDAEGWHLVKTMP